MVRVVSRAQGTTDRMRLISGAGERALAGDFDDLLSDVMAIGGAFSVS